MVCRKPDYVSHIQYIVYFPRKCLLCSTVELLPTLPTLHTHLRTLPTIRGSCFVPAYAPTASTRRAIGRRMPVYSGRSTDVVCTVGKPGGKSPLNCLRDGETMPKIYVIFELFNEIKSRFFTRTPELTLGPRNYGHIWHDR